MTTTSEIITIGLAILSSSAVTAIMNWLANRKKVAAETRHTDTETMRDIVEGYKALVLDQRMHIDEQTAKLNQSREIVRLAPAQARRIDELELELKKERATSAALRAMSSE